MNIAAIIVARLLNEEHFDVHQRTDLYTHRGTKGPGGKAVVAACSNCELEYGADKQYPPDVWMSHSICPRHAAQSYMRDLGYSSEEAHKKAGQGSGIVDWKTVLGPSKMAQSGPPPEQAYWNTSFSPLQ